MYHCVRNLYGVLGCVVHPGRGGGGVEVEGKGKDGRVDTTRIQKLGSITSGGGFLSLFVVVGGYLIWKFQHHICLLWCVIFCHHNVNAPSS